ncbi:MAG: transposase [bacterium]
MAGDKIVHRYSTAFKQKVISEIESGQFTIEQARKIYDIKGTGTIHYWLRKYGKNHLINKVVRIEMKDEKDKIKELERQKRELESALAHEHLKNLCLESLIECVEEHYKVDVKKTFGQMASKKSPSK